MTRRALTSTSTTGKAEAWKTSSPQFDREPLLHKLPISVSNIGFKVQHRRVNRDGNRHAESPELVSCQTLQRT